MANMTQLFATIAACVTNAYATNWSSLMTYHFYSAYANFSWYWRNQERDRIYDGGKQNGFNTN